MIYKPMEAAGPKWRKLTEAYLAVLVRAVVRFVTGSWLRDVSRITKPRD
jgi:hypothetical protein